jgi:molecular chaperone GrpE (heat shock protein)
MDRRTDAMARQFDRVAKKLQRAMSEEAMTLRASAKDCASSVKAVQGALSEVRSEMQGVRDFAMTQQEQLRKYEDGYAWSSIKGLGMRLIRCIDDIDRMIALSGEGSGAIAKLQAVRDELLYALEAQGVEAVTPEDGSPYRGQEQWVKIAGTEETNDPSLNETISNTTRCGYWVEVADNRRKVIRPAESTVYKMEVKSNG